MKKIVLNLRLKLYVLLWHDLFFLLSSQVCFVSLTLISPFDFLLCLLKNYVNFISCILVKAVVFMYYLGSSSEQFHMDDPTAESINRPPISAIGTRPLTGDCQIIPPCHAYIILHT